jgi:arylsulfatase A-like enzyme
LFWRYKANAQRAVRSGDWKYFRISGNEFLFDLATDPRERANLAQRHPEVFATLRQQWEAWDATMLPITKDVKTSDLNGKKQADRYNTQDPD